MGRKPKRRSRARTRAEGSAKERARSRLKGKRPSPIRPSKKLLPGFTVGQLEIQPVTGLVRARSRTILLVEGINQLTGRPIRIYIRPDNVMVACETIGQLERIT